jgi:glyoxylate carboligase
MAGRKVADYLLERLRAGGVEKVFAYPGDGINGLLAAWGRADNDPMFIQARHEEMAAFEAVGYAKFTGKFGVCMATSGPGAIHLLNGLYDAKRAADPPARHLRAGQGLRPGHARGRRGPPQRGDRGRQDQGPGVPAAPRQLRSQEGAVDE